jgi:hypothetical protein
VQESASSLWPPLVMGHGSGAVAVPVAIWPTRILVLCWEVVVVVVVVVVEEVHADRPAVAMRTRSIYSMPLQPLLPHTRLLRPSNSHQLNLNFLTTHAGRLLRR